MALETLKGTAMIKINDKEATEIIDINKAKKFFNSLEPVAQRQDGVDFNRESWEDYKKRVLDPRVHIVVDHDANTISFKIQDGPIKENGLNGCQVVDMVAVARHIFLKLNESYHSEFNDRTIHHLDLALAAQEERTKDRETRNVEGTSAN